MVVAAAAAVVVEAGAVLVEVPREGVEVVVLEPKVKGEVAPKGEGFLAAFAFNPAPRVKAGREGAAVAVLTGAELVTAG